MPSLLLRSSAHAAITTAATNQHCCLCPSQLLRCVVQRLEELKHAQEEELESRLDASVKRILAANRRMAEELRLHVTESESLRAEVELLAGERARLLRELAIKVDMEAGWAARAGQQAAALKESSQRGAALEASLQQVWQREVLEMTDCADLCRVRSQTGRAAVSVAAAVGQPNPPS
jgi:hypothetical protein